MMKAKRGHCSAVKFLPWALAAGAGFFCFPAASPAWENDLIFGAYIFTLHNLETRGATLSYRLWLADGDEEPGREFSLLYPRPLIWGLEVGVARLYQPESAWEGALSLLLRYEYKFTSDLGAFLFVSGGGSYSGVHYSNLSTQLNFLTRGGVGLRFQRFFLQGTYEHRSNGGIRRPNRGVDVIQAAAGFRF